MKKEIYLLGFEPDTINQDVTIMNAQFYKLTTYKFFILLHILKVNVLKFQSLLFFAPLSWLEFKKLSYYQGQNS